VITIWQRMFDTVAILGLVIGTPLAVKFFVRDMWRDNWDHNREETHD